MAEQIPYGVATNLINTLASLAFREIASIYEVKDDIEWLKKTVEKIKAVLSDADQKQHTDQLIQLWVKDLKNVLYEADDLLDELHAQHLLHNRDAKGKGKVREFFSSSNPIVSRHKTANKIRNIRNKFDGVSENIAKLKLCPTVVVAGTMEHEKRNWRPETSSCVLQEEMVGREGDKKEIIDLLLKHDASNNQNVSLVAIVGFGALGKTALAQLVYNDAEVERSFGKRRMWVCVSDDFDVKVLVKRILECLLTRKEDDQSLQLLQDKLQRNLNGEKFLLVLDDIWNEDPQEWDSLRKYLMCGAMGSKILLTTRSQRVANVMGVNSPYLLKGLNGDQSWTLMKRFAVDEPTKMTQNLESVGRKIAEKCGGVPLAIRVMGSLLGTKSRESDWEAILEGDFWKLHESQNSIMPILKLSYDSLTIELKQCFAYCSLYPKDWEYEKDELIDLWMAQGFLLNKDDKQCPEDVGEDYVCILLMKSFLQDVSTDELSGEIKFFKMHDLMHDLSQSIASSDYYVHGRKTTQAPPLHASFEEYNPDDSLNILDPSRLRTFLEMKTQHERNPSEVLVFKHLRSLDLSGYNMSYLPESIGKMSHLRDLNLCGCDQLTCLPKSIVKLVHLETLKLKSCWELEFSVDIITKLVNLRKLDIEGCKAFEDGMPVGMGEMTTLQSLSKFIVGSDEKGRKKAKLNELERLNNLRGSLEITRLGSIINVEESNDVNLRTKKNLISLTLDWGHDRKMENSDALQLLGNLRPHQNLKALRIKEYPGVCLSDWLLSCTNLVELKFHDMGSCQHLAPFEGLVSLKTLRMDNMKNLECIYYKEYFSPSPFFPSLEELVIIGCRSFKGWQKEANVHDPRSELERHPSLPQFSRLSELTIYGCKNLIWLPTFPNLVRKLVLRWASTKPLLDTLNVRRIGPSTSHDHIHMPPSLSMLRSLSIEEIDMESLPEKWMQNLSSLQHLTIEGFSSLEKSFRHMQNLSAALEELQLWFMRSWCGIEDYSIQFQNLCWLHSLRKIYFYHCDHLETLPEWVCDLQNLQSITMLHCPKLVSFPEGMCRLTNVKKLYVFNGSPLLKERCKREVGTEWPKIAHITDVRINGDQI